MQVARLQVIHFPGFIPQNSWQMKIDNRFSIVLWEVRSCAVTDALVTSILNFLGNAVLACLKNLLKKILDKIGFWFTEFWKTHLKIVNWSPLVTFPVANLGGGGAGVLQHPRNFWARPQNYPHYSQHFPLLKLTWILKTGEIKMHITSLRKISDAGTYAIT